MDEQIKLTLEYIQKLTKGWYKFSKATEAYKTSLFECIAHKKTGCSMKARFAQLLLTFLGYEVEIVRGYYKSPERWTLHAWVKVNGKEYDPTRKNFQITRDKHSRTNPDPHLTDWEQVFEKMEGEN
ncbi:MAG: hypothetical protein CEN90_660 [Parcubacteria group bacterium Licking1014_17]|nr:MAG: hypothetical protein CEN90_660 [Parcubacteria group bacterium Licking1014_17]